MGDFQNNLYMQARTHLEENIRFADHYEQLKEIIEEKRGFVKAYWCGCEECENQIKKETKATIRCLPMENNKEKGKCIYCGKESMSPVYFGRAY